MCFYFNSVLLCRATAVPFLCVCGGRIVSSLLSLLLCTFFVCGGRIVSYLLSLLLYVPFFVCGGRTAVSSLSSLLLCIYTYILRTSKYIFVCFFAVYIFLCFVPFLCVVSGAGGKQAAVETVARKRKASSSSSSASGSRSKGTVLPRPLVGPPPVAHSAFLKVRAGLLYSPVVMKSIRAILTNYAEKVKGTKQ